MVRRRKHFTTRAVTVSGADVATKCSCAAVDAHPTSANVKMATTTSTGAAGGVINRSDSCVS